MLHLTTRAEKHLRESSAFIWKLLCAAFLIGLGGIYYVHLQNEHVLIEREITALRCEIRICEMRTNQIHAKAESKTNRWALLDALSQNHSQLSKISKSQIETMQQSPVSDLAHAHPTP